MPTALEQIQQQHKIDFSFLVRPSAIVSKSDDGKRVVMRAVVSDNLEDRGGDRVSEKALQEMELQLKNNRIPLLATHRDTFEFGVSVGAELLKNAMSIELVALFELDMIFPESQSIVRDIENGGTDKQFSIGGRLNRNDPKPVIFETNRQGEIIRILNAINLDHVATTRDGHAMNPRTRDLGLTDMILNSITEHGAWPETPKELLKGDEAPAVELPLDAIAKQFPIAPQTAPWSFTAGDGNAIIARSGMPGFSSAHAFRDTGRDATLRGAYKLPHHKISGGKMKLFPRGVFAATVAFAGGRGGVNLDPSGAPFSQTSEGRQAAAGLNGHKPSTSREAVRTHLLSHYSDIGVEPPDSLKKDDVPYDEVAFVKHHADQGIEMSWLPHFDFEAFAKAESEEDLEALVEGDTPVEPTIKTDDTAPTTDTGAATTPAADKPAADVPTLTLAEMALGLHHEKIAEFVCIDTITKTVEMFEKAGKRMSKESASKIRELLKRLEVVLRDAGAFEGEEPKKTDAPAAETVGKNEGGDALAPKADDAPADPPADAPAPPAADAPADPPADAPADPPADAPAAPKADDAPATGDAPAAGETTEKTVAEQLDEFQKVFLSRVGETMGVIVDEKMKPLVARLSGLEDASGRSQRMDGADAPTAAGVAKGEEDDSWDNIFAGAKKAANL